MQKTVWREKRHTVSLRLNSVPKQEKRQQQAHCPAYSSGQQLPIGGLYAFRIPDAHGHSQIEHIVRKENGCRNQGANGSPLQPAALGAIVLHFRPCGQIQNLLYAWLHRIHRISVRIQ